MERILGVDYGTERIGLALSDPLGIIATPFETVLNDKEVWNRLRMIIAQELVTKIVIGLPLTLKGEMAEKAQEVERFIAEMERHLGLSPVRWDERYTTAIARRSMIEMGTKKKTRREDRGRVDAMAAAVILQSYLDRSSRGRND